MAAQIVTEPEAPSASKAPKRTCLEPHCNELAAFVCSGSILGKEIGCNQNFCWKDKGELSIFFFQKLQLDDDDMFNDKKEALCKYCVDEANTRARCGYGIPIAILSIISIFSIIFSVFGIL